MTAPDVIRTEMVREPTMARGVMAATVRVAEMAREAEMVRDFIIIRAETAAAVRDVRALAATRTEMVRERTITRGATEGTTRASETDSVHLAVQTEMGVATEVAMAQDVPWRFQQRQ